MKTFLSLVLVGVLCVAGLTGCASGFKAADIQSVLDSLAKDQAGVCVADNAGLFTPLPENASIIVGRLNSDNSSLTLTPTSCTVTRGSTYNAPPAGAVAATK
jgi:hypothetical protein